MGGELESREQARRPASRDLSMLFPCMPSCKEMQVGERGGDVGTGHTLTISVDSYPSPPGDPGRKKEQILIKHLGMPPRESSRPHAKLKR